MIRILSHQSALEFWRVPYLETLLKPCQKAHYTVLERKHRYRNKGHIVHLCSLKLPPEAYKKRNGQLIASPEWAYLQVANQLTMLELKTLAEYMCHDQKFITTPQKLLAFVSQMKGHRGYRKAKRALRYVLGNCRSTSEAFLANHLALPKSLGGCAFPKPYLNIRIPVDNGDHFTVDQYYPDHKLIIEYDSDWGHSDPEKIAADNIRAERLRRAGYTVLSLKTQDMYNLDSFERVREFLSVFFKKAVDIQNRTFPTMLTHLRDLLPRRNGGRQNRTELRRYLKHLGLSLTYYPEFL